MSGGLSSRLQRELASILPYECFTPQNRTMFCHAFVHLIPSFTTYIYESWTTAQQCEDEKTRGAIWNVLGNTLRTCMGNMMWTFYELNRDKLGIQRIKTHLPQPLLLPLKPKRKRLSAQLVDPIETAHQVGWVDEWQGLWIENIVSCIPLSLWTSVSSILAILMHLYQPSCHQVPTLHGTFNWYHIVEELDLRFGPLLLNRSYQWVKRCQSHKFIQ
jgi:hypothetical protein